MSMTTGNGQAERVNLYGSDGKVKARLNRVTLELVVKERGQYHTWRLAAMVAAVAEPDAKAIDPVFVS